MTNQAGIVVQHWYDFICPFCYVAQDRNALLRWSRIAVEDLAFPIHPDIGPGGAAAPLRVGPAYAFLRHEAEQAGLPLVWSDRIAYSRPALGRSEIVRRVRPARHAEYCRVVFDAYFGKGLDIESEQVLDDCARLVGVEDLFDAGRWSTAEADRLVDDARDRGSEAGVTGTPAWLVSSQLLVGLRPLSEFERIAENLALGPS